MGAMILFPSPMKPKFVKFQSGGRTSAAPAPACRGALGSQRWLVSPLLTEKESPLITDKNGPRTQSHTSSAPSNT